MQMLYQAEVGDSEVTEVVRSFDPFEAFAARDEPVRVPAERLRKAFDFARGLVSGTVARLDEIDRLISAQANNWRLERMPAVDRNILRLAVYELLEEDDVPPLVVLDEAIELAKQYGSDQSSSFVNGLLDGLLKSLREDEATSLRGARENTN